MLDINEVTNLNNKEYKEFIDKINCETISSTEELITLNKTLIEEISKIPASTFENINPNSTGFGGKYYNPCEHCPNNPKNNPFNSAGFCNCVLPTLYNPIY